MEGRQREPADSANGPIVPAAVLEPKQVEAQASGKPPVQEYRH